MGSTGQTRSSEAVACSTGSVNYENRQAPYHILSVSRYKAVVVCPRVCPDPDNSGQFLEDGTPLKSAT